jgi:hypothetical protein
LYKTEIIKDGKIIMNFGMVRIWGEECMTLADRYRNIIKISDIVVSSLTKIETL